MGTPWWVFSSSTYIEHLQLIHNPPNNPNRGACARIRGSPANGYSISSSTHPMAIHQSSQPIHGCPSPVGLIRSLGGHSNKYNLPPLFAYYKRGQCFEST